jgi:hypothetical protein
MDLIITIRVGFKLLDIEIDDFLHDELNLPH